jgi:hypothetical protein
MRHVLDVMLLFQRGSEASGTALTFPALVFLALLHGCTEGRLRKRLLA